MSRDEEIHEPGARRRSLKAAVRRARLVQADRSDVIVELRASEQARLELLLEELRPVFDEIADADQFSGVLVPGDPPRLWVDILSYVAMGIDKRTYRFIKDTSQGRRILHENQDVGDIADKVTEYLAHRVIEREQALAGDIDSDRKVFQPASATARRRHFGFPALVLGFLGGVATGMVLLFVVGAYFAAG